MAICVIYLPVFAGTRSNVAELTGRIFECEQERTARRVRERERYACHRVYANTKLGTHVRRPSLAAKIYEKQLLENRGKIFAIIFIYTIYTIK